MKSATRTHSKSDNVQHVDNKATLVPIKQAQLKLTEYFEYLDNLRESGLTNMFGAGEWLENAYELEEGVAKDVLVLWMKTFDGKRDAATRAIELKPNLSVPESLVSRLGAENKPPERRKVSR